MNPAFGAIGSAIAGAIGGAINSMNKGSGSGSGGSSSTSSSSTRWEGPGTAGGGSSASGAGSSASTSKPNYANSYTGSGGNYQLTTEDIDAILNEAKQNSAAWQTADEAGKEAYHDRNRYLYGDMLGMEYDPDTGKWSDTAITSGIKQSALQNSNNQKAQQQMQQALEAQQAAADAAVAQAIAALEGQRYNVNQVGQAANKAAQDAYMQTIDPNGGLAESLASRGLLSSGVTESSMIAAGNTYQNALNENARTVMEQLQQIDRDIENARLTGDISKAQALQDYAMQVAQQGMQNTAALIGIQQWGWSQNQADKQQAFDNQMAINSYNDQKTLIEQQRDAGIIDLETAKIQLNYLDRLLQEQYRGAQLTNDYQQMQNQYAQSAF